MLKLHVFFELRSEKKFEFPNIVGRRAEDGVNRGWAFTSHCRPWTMGEVVEAAALELGLQSRGNETEMTHFQMFIQ